MIIAPTSRRPTMSSAGEPVSSPSSALTAPNSATSAKVRRPAFAPGWRSRSRPISKPMARLAANAGSLSSSVPCNQISSRSSPSVCARLPIIQHQLHRALAVVLVHLHTVDRGNPPGKRGLLSERNCIQHALPPGAAQPQFQMPAADNALFDDLEIVEKTRHGKSLTPYLGFERLGEIEIHVGRRQFAIGLDQALQVGGTDELPHDRFEGSSEIRDSANRVVSQALSPVSGRGSTGTRCRPTCR